MGLRFRYGDWATAENYARPSSLTVSTRDSGGFPVSHIWSLTCEVILLVDGPGGLTSALTALNNALTVPFQDGGIEFTPNGGLNWYSTHHFVYNAGSIGGVIANQAAFPQSPLQYATEQTVSVTLTAEYHNTALVREIIKWEETLEIVGEGGPDYVLRPRWNSPSIVQARKPYTDVQVLQSGLIVARSAYAGLPNPLITTAGARKGVLTRDRKKPVQKGTALIEFHRSYSYQFDLPSHPGYGVPNVLT